MNTLLTAVGTSLLMDFDRTDDEKASTSTPFVFSGVRCEFEPLDKDMTFSVPIQDEIDSLTATESESWVNQLIEVFSGWGSGTLRIAKPKQKYTIIRNSPDTVRYWATVFNQNNPQVTLGWHRTTHAWSRFRCPTVTAPITEIVLQSLSNLYRISDDEKADVSSYLTEYPQLRNALIDIHGHLNKIFSGSINYISLSRFVDYEEDEKWLSVEVFTSLSPSDAVARFMTFNNWWIGVGYANRKHIVNMVTPQ